MSKLIIALATITTLVFPSPTLAITDDALTDDASSSSSTSSSSTSSGYVAPACTNATIGDYSCTCITDDSSFDVEASSEASCNAACAEIDNAETYTLYKCELNSAHEPEYDMEAQGNVAGESASDDDAAAPPKNEAIIPDLNVDIPGLDFSTPTTDGGLISVNFLGEYIVAAYKYAIVAGSVIAVTMLMIGGLQYALARGKSKYIDTAKKRISNAITGIVLLLAAYNIAFLINPQLINFESLNVQYIPYVFVSTENTERDADDLDLPTPGGGTNGVPYYSQRDYDNTDYGCNGTTVKSSGCGPTAAAMVLSHLGVRVDPEDVAEEFLEGGYRVCGAGTSYSAFTNSQIIKENGLVGEVIPISQEERIVDLLEANNPIIISVGPSRFTSAGHFMVLTGVEPDGDFMLNDPNSGYTSATQKEIFDAIKFAVYIHKD